MNKVAEKQNILFQWLIFQFFDAPKGILRAWYNFLLFNLNYFSVLVLLRTFFSHWRRYKWSYPRGFNIGQYIETFVSNLISRILGAIMRTFLIFIGLFVEILIFFSGFLAILFWLMLPIILILGIYHGFRILLF